ncbi:hypothetical protein LJR255_004996 [Pararhizobium sp. LjRoot255]|uniref:hypothetical protein n=1 Tax=Pararhizobium sp. LjRoot255 TaxID=3342298 RepID=UPI003ECFB9AB
MDALSPIFEQSKETVRRLIDSEAIEKAEATIDGKNDFAQLKVDGERMKTKS